MRQEAERHASEDTQRKEQAETRNAADSLAYTAEKTLRDHGDKLPADLKQDIEAKTAALRETLKGQDAAPIQAAMQELSDTIQKAGSAVYGEQPGAGTPGADAGEQPGADDGTVEGEFREV